MKLPKTRYFNIKSITGFTVMLTLFILLGSWQLSTADKRNKRIDKFICKAYKKQKVTKVMVALPDSLKLFEEDAAYKLMLNDSLVGYMIYSRANCCRLGGCAVYNGQNANNGNYDPFYFATIYNINLTIKKIEVLEYYSDYGYEITSKRWLKQFINKMGCKLNYEDDIDGISGATISVMSMIDVVNKNCGVAEYLKSK